MISQKNEFNFNVKKIDSEGFFAGYASVFGVLDSQKDIILEGAFKNAIVNNDIKLLWQHKVDSPIGNILSLEEDSYGLFVEAKLLLDIEKGKEAYSLLKSGSINSMSIGYKINDVEYDDFTGVRFIKDVDLFEISLVTFPANQDAVVTSVKSKPVNTIREYENFLRENGFSRKEAKEIALYGFKSEEIKILNEAFDRAMRMIS